MNRFVGVGFYKQSQKWRAYVRVRGPAARVDGKLRSTAIFKYVGVFPTPAIAAVAREEFIHAHPSLSAATHNVIPADAYLAYANYKQGPEESPLIWTTNHHGFPEEIWRPFPGNALWELSSAGRVRKLSPGGFMSPVQDGDTVTLCNQDGLLRRYKISLLLREFNA